MLIRESLRTLQVKGTVPEVRDRLSPRPQSEHLMEGSNM